MKSIERLYRISKFAQIMRKLYGNKEMEQDELEYVLGCSMLLFKEYDTTRERDLFELAYAIILRYTRYTNDYQPLYDVSCNYGFFPTVQFINKKKLLKNHSIQNAVLDYKVQNKYSNNEYIETYEQNKTRLSIISSENRNIAFIAPTSSGKSSLIIQHIQKNDRIKKAVVIVPTKSLIAQSYMELRKGVIDRKIISHESMYNDGESFIGVLTQERLLRLLENHESLYLDCIYVDEAHNIFSNDNRNVLLARALKICNERNNNTQIIFLSPFINDVNNLSFGQINEIVEQRISYEIKEPDIYVKCKDGAIEIYDRFYGDFYDVGKSDNPFKYISSNLKRKNFIFINTPPKIEAFAEELYKNTDEIELDDDLVELQKILINNVHPDFNVIRYISHGIVYLHAKMPDHIKEFLEYQFKIKKKLRYLIANVVIMEGINLPIDCLFICNTWNMTGVALKNLVGRVNRLNDIYDLNNGDLNKLIPEIHFVDVPNFTAKKIKLENSVKKMFFEKRDEVRNPLLEKCSLEDLKGAKKERVINTNKKIIEQENIYYSESKEEVERFRKKLIVSGMNQFIDVSRQNAVNIMNNIQNCNFNMDIIDIVAWVFTRNVNVIDQEFKRLDNSAAVHFYKFFMSELRKGDFAALITSQLEYQLTRVKKDNNPYMYVGSGYGDKKGWDEEKENSQTVYVDVREKTKAQLINLLIVKTKIEQEFLSFQYNRAVNFLHDNGYIDDERYNLEIYGTNDESKIRLLNLGISFSLLNVLDSNNQVCNISLDEYGNMVANEELNRFKDKQNALVKYEMDKFILFKTE